MNFNYLPRIIDSILKELVELVGREMPAIKVTDEDYGQLEIPDDESRETYPLTFPAVLIDCPDVNWNNIQGNNQKGVANRRVKLAIDCYDDIYTMAVSELIVNKTSSSEPTY